MANSRTEALKRDLAAAYEGSKWHSFKTSVHKLSEHEAHWKPAHYKGFLHMDGSILNIIFHLGGDSHFQLDYALGQRKLNWNALTQRFNEMGGDLNAALQLAEEGYQKLQSALDALTDEELANTYASPEGRERTLEGFFRMMIEHHHYHAGQIVYIRSLIKGM